MHAIPESPCSTADGLLGGPSSTGYKRADGPCPVEDARAGHFIDQIDLDPPLAGEPRAELDKVATGLIQLVVPPGKQAFDGTGVGQASNQGVELLGEATVGPELCVELLPSACDHELNSPWLRLSNAGKSELLPEGEGLLSNHEQGQAGP